MNRAVKLTVLGICLAGLFALTLSASKGAAQEYSEVASKPQARSDKARCKDLPGEKQLKRRFQRAVSASRLIASQCASRHDCAPEATRTQGAFLISSQASFQMVDSIDHFSMSTAMPRHFPCLNRSALNAQRIACPTRMAIQISSGSSSPVCRMTKQMPSGTMI